MQAATTADMMGLTLYRWSGVCVEPGEEEGDACEADGDNDASVVADGGGGGGDVREVKWRYRHMSINLSLGIRSAMWRKWYLWLQCMCSWGSQLIPISRTNPRNAQMSSSFTFVHFTPTSSRRTCAA